MAKPDKTAKGGGRTVADWEERGWVSAIIPAGETSLEVSFDSETQDINVRRLLYDDEGNLLKGHGHPKVKVEHTDSGVIVALNQAADTDLTVLYRIVEEDEDEDEDEDLG